MIARFRPTYSYSDIFSALFSSIKSVETIRAKIQEMYKTEHVFFYSQARVALYTLLKTLSIKGAVISPAYNCIVVPDTIRFAGMVNQFADISLEDYNMSPKKTENVVNNKSKILLATHQFGIPCDIEAFLSIAKKNNLILIEDAAAAMGAKINSKIVGTFTKASILSFQDTKVLNGVVGGCLLVYDKELALRVKEFSFEIDLLSRLKLLRQAMSFKIATIPSIYSLIFPIWTAKAGSYTMAESSEEKMPVDYLKGISSMSAALINLQIDQLEQNINKREFIARKYLSTFNKGGIDLPKIAENVQSVWVRFPVRVENRLDFFKKLSSKGVDLAWTFSYSCTDEYGGLGTPNSMEASKSVLNLPIYPNLKDDEVNKIINSVMEII